MIILNNERLGRVVLQNDRILNEFPFLNAARKSVPPGNCASCEREKYELAWRKAANDAKRRLGELDAAKASRLCELLGTTRIRLHYHDAAGEPQVRMLRK